MDGLGDGEAEPRRRVAESECPDAADDLLGALDRADALGLHRVTDGDVALDCERRQTQRRRVDPCELDTTRELASTWAACQSSVNWDHAPTSADFSIIPRFWRKTKMAHPTDPQIH